MLFMVLMRFVRDEELFELIQKAECEVEEEKSETIYRDDVLSHIDRIKNSGMGKIKALDSLYKIVKFIL